MKKILKIILKILNYIKKLFAKPSYYVVLVDGYIWALNDNLVIAIKNK